MDNSGKPGSHNSRHIELLKSKSV